MMDNQFIDDDDDDDDGDGDDVDDDDDDRDELLLPPVLPEGLSDANSSHISIRYWLLHTFIHSPQIFL